MSGQAEVLDLFPAVVTSGTLDMEAGWREQLRAHILATREIETEGLSKSNVGGWHSRRLRGEIIDTLEAAIMRRAEDYARRMAWDLLQHQLAFTDDGLWAIVNGKGATNALHIHEDAHLSGVYYVDAPAGSGDLVLEAPRPPHAGPEPVLARQTMKNVHRLAAVPRAGLLLLFPSWLPHRVDPNQTDAARIAVSFNIALIPRGSTA